jgi:murein DD-endopeptidase MepM/ murein hydrolase activator NlpD/pimeloyl-ACP methyl ester carboxylesterase
VGTCSGTVNPNPTPANQPSSANNGGDGLYTIKQRAIDSSGNRGEWTQKVVERDTVSPSNPTLTLTAPGIKGEQTLALTVSGEGYAKTSINIYKKLSNVFVKNLDPNLTSNGDYTSSNLIGQLECDEDGTGNGYNYTVKVTLKDRAGNISGEVTATIKTLPCPRCVGTSTGGWSNPIHDYRVRETSGYRTAQRPDHNGADLNVGQDENGTTIAGTPIYAAKDGTIEYARYSYTDAERWTPDGNGGYLDTSNYVIINHNDGTKTHYVHLQYSQTPIVTQNQTVTTNTIIGYMGQTGQATAPHLHFGVFINGVDTDPSQPSILNLDGDDATASQQATKCRKVGEGDVPKDLEDWNADYKEADQITINFNKAIWPLSGAYFKSIEGFNPIVTKITRASDVKYGLSSSDDKGQYKVSGVAPYKGQSIKIKVWDGNNLTEEKTEQLQSAKIIGRKNTLNVFDETMFSEKENIGTKGRFNFDVLAKWSIDPSWNDGKKVTEQDELFFDTKLYHQTSCNGGTCKIPDGFTYYNNEKASNRVKIQNDLKEIPFTIGKGAGIEQVETVSGTNSDTTKYTKAQSANERQVKLNLINGNSTYNGGNIWILSHGWNGGLGIMKDIGNNIRKDSITSNDNVIVVDWREASHSGNNPADVCISSTWTKSVATKIHDKLVTWGVNDSSKIRLVGHSMGTILNTEIGKTFNKVDTSYSLDAPSDPCFGGYNVQINGDIKKSNLNTGANKARGFAGLNSLAGSQEHNRTADLSFQIDFNTTTTNTAEHSWVQETWRQMLDTDRLEGNTLGARDLSPHSTWERDGFGPIGWQGNNGRLFTNNQYWANPVNTQQQGAGVVNRLEYKDVLLGKQVKYKQ